MQVSIPKMLSTPKNASSNIFRYQDIKWDWFELQTTDVLIGNNCCPDVDSISVSLHLTKIVLTLAEWLKAHCQFQYLPSLKNNLSLMSTIDYWHQLSILICFGVWNIILVFEKRYRWTYESIFLYLRRDIWTYESIFCIW